MRTEVECLPCFVRQALQVARIAKCSPELQLRVVQKIAAIVANLDVNLSPPANASQIYRAIAEITACEDPYRRLKTASNTEALKILPRRTWSFPKARAILKAYLKSIGRSFSS